MADAFGATMAVLIFLTLLMGGGYFFVQHKNRQLEEERSRRIEAENQQRHNRLIELHSMICSRISDIAELATVREDFVGVIDFKDAKSVKGITVPFTSRNFRMTYEGVAVCGCDLSRYLVPQNSITEHSAQIMLPACQILHIYPKTESYKIIDNSTGLFAKNFSLEEQNNFVTANLFAQKQRLLYEGILERANENVRQIIWAQMQPIGIAPRIIFLNDASTQGVLPAHQN